MGAPRSMVPVPPPYVGTTLPEVLELARRELETSNPGGVAWMLGRIEAHIRDELLACMRSAVEQGEAAARAGASQYVVEAGALAGQLRRFLALPPTPGETKGGRR